VVLYLVQIGAGRALVPPTVILTALVYHHSLHRGPVRVPRMFTINENRVENGVKSIFLVFLTQSSTLGTKRG